MFGYGSSRKAFSGALLWCVCVSGCGTGEGGGGIQGIGFRGRGTLQKILTFAPPSQS